MSVLNLKGVHSRQPTEDEQPSFAGGLNTVSNDYALKEDQMRRADNVRLVDIGAATKRGGTQRTASALAAFPVKGGYSWRQSSSTTYTLAMCNGSLFTTTYGGFPLTWTNRGGSFAATNPVFAGFRDTSANVVYIATGGALQKWDGTTLTSLAPPVHATGVCVYHDRLWGWGVSGATDSIYYSNLSSATSSIGGDSLGVGASSGGQIVVRTFGQQDVVACAPVGTSLLIFHKVGISRLTGFGQSDITVTPDVLTSEYGLVGANALAVHAPTQETAYGPYGPASVYFVSPSGVCMATENATALLGTPDKPDPVLPQLLTLSSSDLSNVRCVFNQANRELWVQLPGLGIYIYHTILKSWSGPFVDGYLSPDTTCLFQAIDGNGQPIVLRGDNSGFVSLCDPPNVFLDNVASDGTGGTAYNAVIQLHRMFSGDPTRADAFRWAEVLAALKGSASVNIGWNTLTDAGSFQLPASGGGLAWGGSGTTWGSGTWGLGGLAPFYVPLSGTGPFIDLTITDSGQAASQYASVQLTGTVLGRR